MIYIAKDDKSLYLKHHGILGQKWGKQNGPPYPLSTGDHSKAEVKAGYKKSIGGDTNPELYDRKRKKLDKKAEKIRRKELRKAEKEFSKTEFGSKNYDEEKHREVSAKIGVLHNMTTEQLIESKKAGKDYIKKLTDDKLLEWKKRDDEERKKEKEIAEKRYNTVSSNINKISNDMANEMIKDLKRWGEFSEKDSKLKNDFVKQIKESINFSINQDNDNVFEYNNGDLSIVIYGFEKYSDYAPLTIQIDKNGKFKDFYYT